MRALKIYAISEVKIDIFLKTYFQTGPSLQRRPAPVPPHRRLRLGPPHQGRSHRHRQRLRSRPLERIQRSRTGEQVSVRESEESGKEEERVHGLWVSRGEFLQTRLKSGYGNTNGPLSFLFCSV